MIGCSIKILTSYYRCLQRKNRWFMSLRKKRRHVRCTNLVNHSCSTQNPFLHAHIFPHSTTFLGGFQADTFSSGIGNAAQKSDLSNKTYEQGSPVGQPLGQMQINCTDRYLYLVYVKRSYLCSGGVSFTSSRWRRSGNCVPLVVSHAHIL